MVTGRVKVGVRVAAGIAIAAVAAGCGGLLGDDEDGDDSSGSSSAPAASSEPAESSTGAESSAKEATPPKVVPRNAVMAIGGTPKFTYRITDESLVRETITVWRGNKRLAIAVGKELSPAGRRTGVAPFPEAPWATKPETLKWCVRGFDEHGNKSKAVCAKLKVQVKEPPADTATSEETTTSDEATSGATDTETGSSSAEETETTDTAGSDTAASEDSSSG